MPVAVEVLAEEDLTAEAMAEEGLTTGVLAEEDLIVEVLAEEDLTAVDVDSTMVAASITAGAGETAGVTVATAGGGTTDGSLTTGGGTVTGGPTGGAAAGGAAILTRSQCPSAGCHVHSLRTRSTGILTHATTRA
jgi:hypothetical protein